MPELPEVETIARELRPLVLGATITGFETDWPKAIKHPDPDAFAAGVAGREVTEVSRRAKWLVLELSGGMVLAIQVKMTGQVFVLPTGTTRVFRPFPNTRTVRSGRSSWPTSRPTSSSSRKPDE